MCLRFADALFDDKRIAVSVLIVWLSIVLIVFKEVGLLESKFMSFGPSKDTVFMTVVLDTYYKWGLVSGFTFVNTLMNDFMSDAISPWLTNCITDFKTKYIPYSKSTCLAITQIWSLYCNVMSVFGIFLATTQLDLIIIRTIADLMVNFYSTRRFLRNKTYCSERYRQVVEMHEPDQEMSKILTTVKVEEQKSCISNFESNFEISA